MKTICEKRLVFITPAFLSGANQNQPEIRVPSIRGAIRWWFRVLGGTPEQEASVFGGVHGGAQASKVLLRVEAVQINRGETIRAPQGTPRGYLYYFATVSGNKDGVHRTEQGHYVAPGSSFRLKVFLRQELAEEDEALLLLAIDAFLALGSLGLRATRGCGAFAVDEASCRDEFLAWIDSLPDSVFVGLVNSEVYPTAQECQSALSVFLQDMRRKTQCSGKKQSAFGFSLGKARESSALKLRPVKVKEGCLPVVVYSDAACGQGSQLDAVRDACV